MEYLIIIERKLVKIFQLHLLQVILNHIYLLYSQHVQSRDSGKDVLLLSFSLFCSEYAKRFAIFQHNLVKARKMQEMDKGSAKYGVTVFSDLTGIKVIVLSR